MNASNKSDVIRRVAPPLVIIGFLAVLTVCGLSALGFVKRRNVMRSLSCAIHYEAQMCQQSKDVYDSAEFRRFIGTLENGPILKEPIFEDHPLRFIDWEAAGEGFTPPDEYPLIYETNASGNFGLGVNVCTVDHRVFFDYRCRWLQKFSATHPSANIQIPK
jgi:hypothetical protein